MSVDLQITLLFFFLHTALLDFYKAQLSFFKIKNIFIHVILFSIELPNYKMVNDYKTICIYFMNFNNYSYYASEMKNASFNKH